jgi:hypothetical protein
MSMIHLRMQILQVLSFTEKYMFNNSSGLWFCTRYLEWVEVNIGSN